MRVYQPGNESSEYWKALRAEALGVILFVAGTFLSIVAHGHDEVARGLGLTAIGAYTVVNALKPYALARGGVKAAAVRPKAEVAPRSL